MEKGDSQEERRPSGGPLPPGTAVLEISLKELHYRTLVGYLFSHPKLALALLCARPFMYKSMLAIILLCVFGGLAMAFFRNSWGREEIRSGVEFVHQSVGDVRMEGKSLVWSKKDAVLPVAWEQEGFRLTVTSNSDADAARKDSVLSSSGATSRMGLVISPEHIWCWSGTGGAGEEFAWQELPVMGHLHGLDGSGEFLLDEKSIPVFAQLFTVAVFMARWFIESSALISQWLVWCAMMSMISLFTGVAIGRVRGGRPLTQTDPRGDVVMMPLWRRLQLAVSLSANMTLIPMLAALIYSASGFGAPSSLVGIMFMVYLIYGVIEGRRGTLVSPSSRGRRR